MSSPIIGSPSSHHSSSSSSTSNVLSTRAQRRGSRTTNACEACKKRKTKCSGPPGPCEACHKVETFCHFNARLDTRRKLAYKPAAVQERQQYILHGLLQILKFGDDDEILKLINLIRGQALPQEIAACLRQSIKSLQDRGILRALSVDETDIMSLGLQGLFSHRSGKPGLKQPPKKMPTSIKSCLTDPQESRSRLESPNDNKFSLSSSSASQQGPRAYRNDSLFYQSPNETNLTSPLSPLDSISLPSDDTNQPYPGVSAFPTTEDIFAQNRDTDHKDPALQYLMSYNSHPLSGVGTPRQWPPASPATWSIAPELTFNDHTLKSNIYTSRQMDDFNHIENDQSVRHRTPFNEWNVPSWGFETSAT
ncbi:hypothetical protein LTR70_006499 [Exophiala xenobiotica]|uniref:Zn(2)-C6 fungal-type domain-containing protein n=1 Tax=Lithohypha guttulata TaxID=1690604 RepID=A0ABR0JXN9_9EURO|nr:hypothetical protein LTR24_009208 [Lithohypha guttulata]KAK5315947.1 hypothetical protein LTR70_006499 [Exophiala xenobiotica]